MVFCFMESTASAVFLSDFKDSEIFFQNLNSFLLYESVFKILVVLALYILISYHFFTKK